MEPIHSGAGHMPYQLPAIGQAMLKTSTNSISGTGGGDTTITLDAYAFFPDIITNAGSKPLHQAPSLSVQAPDAPRFEIQNITGGDDWDVAWRRIDA